MKYNFVGNLNGVYFVLAMNCTIACICFVCPAWILHLRILLILAFTVCLYVLNIRNIDFVSSFKMFLLVSVPDPWKRLCGKFLAGTLTTSHHADSYARSHLVDSLASLRYTESLTKSHIADSIKKLHIADSLATLLHADSLATRLQDVTLQGSLHEVTLKVIL